MKIRGSAVPAISGAVVGGAVFVLLVDDDAAFANAAARSFESVGMRAVVALGSMAALDVFKNDEIDVVVTDLKLPAGEPSALARMISNRRPQAPVIVMSAHPEFLERASSHPVRCCASRWRSPSSAARLGCAKPNNGRRVLPGAEFGPRNTMRSQPSRPRSPKN